MRFKLTVKYKPAHGMFDSGIMYFTAEAINEQHAERIVQKSPAFPEGGIITKTVYAPRKRK